MWMDRARKDLRAAERNQEIGEFDVAAFLSQQAAEKALKALHLQRSGKFEKIHDLVRLGSQLRAPEEVLERCKRLDRAYVTTRYPDVGEEATREEAEGLVRDAQEVLRWTQKQTGC